MFTREPAQTFHRCFATRKDFLSTARFPIKSTAQRQVEVEESASGAGRAIRGMQAGGSVVDFGEHPDHIHSPGPNVSHYEQFRAQAGAHLIFNHSGPFSTFAYTRCLCVIPCTK